MVYRIMEFIRKPGTGMTSKKKILTREIFNWKMMKSRLKTRIIC